MLSGSCKKDYIIMCPVENYLHSFYIFHPSTGHSTYQVFTMDTTRAKNLIKIKSLVAMPSLPGTVFHQPRLDTNWPTQQMPDKDAGHCCEAWTLNRTVTRSINGFNSRCLHVMTGEHYRETATAPAYDLVLAVRRRRLRYLGHVLHMPADRMVRCALMA